MKRIWHLTILIALVGLLAGFSSKSLAAGKEEMIKAAEALDKAFVGAFNRGDVEALSATYWNSPEVILFPPGELEVRGIAGVKQACKDLFAEMPGAQLELTESHQIPLGDAVAGWGLWRITLPGPDGEPIQMIGRYTDLKAQRDGKWVYILDHASSPLPPAEDQPAAD